MKTLTKTFLVATVCAAAIAFPQRRAEASDELAFLDTMTVYLEFMDRWRGYTAQEDMAVLLALESIKEQHEKAGTLAEGVKTLEGLLESSKEQSVRNLLHFGLRDLYEKMNDRDNMLRHMAAVVSENESALRSGKGERNPSKN